ncbi:GerAB/ArcD/ProY family transporter [Cohnella panacarvi]|uniref:GerAB/ArcD/ProY family transporter n=1 Tax=Cohnella panacarvi TaxID=400776 RepID=UPI000479BF02|nr:endospore germination permease [Cohnella panacarvi]
MTKLRISNGMFISMIVNMIFVKSIGVTQGTLARIAGQDMWLATLLGTLQGMLFMYVAYLVMKRAPGMNFLAIGEALLGNWLGKIVALVVLTFFIASSGPIMITFVYHLQDYFLPEAPLSLFLVSSLLVGALGCFYGLEVVARLALLGMLFIFLLNVLIIIGSTQEFDIRNLLPVLEQGFPSAAEASLHYDADCAMAIMMAAIVMPFVNNADKHGGKVGMTGLAATGMVTLIWALLEGAVLSAEVTSRYTVSCMKLARNAHIGDFMQRYEMIMIALYSIPVLFEIMICIYGTSVSMSKLFGMRSNRWMIVPACLLIGGFSYRIVGDHFRAMQYLEKVWPYIAVPIAFGLPVVMLGLAVILRGRLRQAG